MKSKSLPETASQHINNQVVIAVSEGIQEVPDPM